MTLGVVANPEHLEIIRRGRFIWNDWRQDHPDVKPDLRKAYLREADLRSCNLADCDLRGAVLLGANLDEVELMNADLSYADVRFVEFSGAKLVGARFHEAQGVTPEVLRATKGPSRLQRAFKKGAPALVALAACAYVYVEYGPMLTEAVEVSLESVAGAASETAKPPPQGEHEIFVEAKPSPLGGPASYPKLESPLRGIEFAGWRVAWVGMDEGVVVVGVDQESVGQDTYLPTLAAACGALAGREDLRRIREIRVVNESGQSGWVYENPGNCANLLAARPTMMRLAIAAESKPYRAPEL